MNLKSAVVTSMRQVELTKEEGDLFHSRSPYLGNYLHASRINVISGNSLSIVSFEATYGWLRKSRITIVGAINYTGNVYIFTGSDSAGYLAGHELDAINKEAANKQLLATAIIAYKRGLLRESLNEIVFGKQP